MARTVLVVDDEPFVRDATADLLTALDCDVTTAGNGTEALVRLKADARIDLLITDIHMPGLSGYELAEVGWPFCLGGRRGRVSSSSARNQHNSQGQALNRPRDLL